MGRSVSLNYMGDAVAVSEHYRDSGSANKGAVIIYKWSVSKWDNKMTITNLDHNKYKNNRSTYITNPTTSSISLSNNGKTLVVTVFNQEYNLSETVIIYRYVNNN